MSATNGLEALTVYRMAIDAAVEEFFDSVPSELGVELSAYGAQAFDRLKAYCLRPGKRIRGSLAALTYDAATGTELSEEAVQLGVVLEILQAYLLIIDDVMDRSELRRGEPALHMLYRANAHSEHDADMIAINVSLLAQHVASYLLACIHVPAESLVRTTQLLQRNMAVTGLGQLEDVSVQPGPDVSQNDIIRKYIQKSSFYTFVNPLQVGFALAGEGDVATLKICEEFGIAAGIAFQLHDDYLGMFGESEELGKSTLDDLQEGKFTLLMQYALEHAPDADAKTLSTLLGNSNVTDSDLKTVQDILIASGAQTYCVEQATTYADAAKRLLSDSEVGTAQYRAILSNLVEYSISRER